MKSLFLTTGWRSYRWSIWFLPIQSIYHYCPHASLDRKLCLVSLQDHHNRFHLKISYLVGLSLNVSNPSYRALQLENHLQFFLVELHFLENFLENFSNRNFRFIVNGLPANVKSLCPTDTPLFEYLQTQFSALLYIKMVSQRSVPMLFDTVYSKPI